MISRLDHDANVRPWLQAADAVGARSVGSTSIPPPPRSTWTALRRAINDRTRIVAITAASNLLGTKPPLADIARIAHDAGALVHVDGVHYAAHQIVDIGALGADLFVCSPYKFLGPHCGVLAATPGLLDTLSPDKLLPSTNAVPERFELGTLPYETMAGADSSRRLPRRASHPATPRNAVTASASRSAAIHDPRVAALPTARSRTRSTWERRHDPFARGRSHPDPSAHPAWTPDLGRVRIPCAPRTCSRRQAASTPTSHSDGLTFQMSMRFVSGSRRTAPATTSIVRSRECELRHVVARDRASDAVAAEGGQACADVLSDPCSRRCPRARLTSRHRAGRSPRRRGRDLPPSARPPSRARDRDRPSGTARCSTSCRRCAPRRECSPSRTTV